MLPSKNPMTDGALTIGIVGGTGKMGRAIFHESLNREDMSTSLILARRADLLEADRSFTAADQEARSPIQFLTTVDKPSCRVMIDFSHPSMMERYVPALLRSPTPLVIGTSGVRDHPGFAGIEQLSRYAPVLAATNVSLGMSILFHMVKEISKLMPISYHAEVLDIHQRTKREAPGDTAKKLAQTLAECRGKAHQAEFPIVMNGESRGEGDLSIGVQALRLGYGVGEHTVYFAGPGERLELTHRVFDRSILAKTVLSAAEWIVDQAPGLYDMNDFYGII
ncbi:4-hydroxy-tetrahydrodipicolinate reductase [Cohnella lubricantis]|uniref:4-hydroxy-tetrahydrodipicolinate reductase n=1 Tax=Cohnella lubricantis TaxID=2163172 RepID=A0A841T957_9BACL|nr:4-hydroxy-tetrahydrodipicolinate reductase [Cohnella lubricantis]MBB6677472.1 4-hydroxy-tetrahydrodipicolinate reductase [Cohnella lubricantis]MBP2116642.1 4-hydroxy-tetrahydrodipicolinate reductase [Cohnella lubricantis]